MRGLWALLLGWIVLCGGGSAAYAQGLDVLGDAEKELTEGLTEDEIALQERLRKLEERLSKKQARVVVLQWPDSEMGHENVLLQELVRNRIGRPSAKFYPSYDLYQEGRRRREDHGDPVPATKQEGTVPEALLVELRGEIQRARDRLARNPREAVDIANALLPWTYEIWFIDRPEVRRAMFELYLMLGRAAYVMDEHTPPFYQLIGRNQVNFGLYMAAALIWEEKDHEDASLAALLPRDEVGRVVQDIVNDLDDGFYETLKVAFHDKGTFDPMKFAREYTAVVNGLRREVLDSGILQVPRGRIDLYLERNDGFSMSESVLVSRLDEKIYFTLETARQKMGYDLLNQLMDTPSTCVVRLELDTRASIAAYAAMHPNDEIYVAIPRLGSYRDLYIWQYDRQSGTLELMIDRNRGFPVRFALISTTGMVFNGATISGDKYETLSETDPATATESSPFEGLSIKDLFSPDLAAIPIDFQLRAHFNRLMFGVGVQIGSNVTAEDEAEGGGKWLEMYQTQDPEGEPPHLVVQDTPPDDVDAGSGYRSAFKELEWQRLIYAHLGVVLLKDAPFGMGPRGYVRVGWYNAPHALDLTGHIGITEEPSFGKKEYKGRVIPLLDADFFAGVMVPFGDTLYREGGRPIILPTFGFTLGAGLSF